ncbi:MAG: hypothetical protein JNL52_10420 [Flavobacteriales bacterium]|nr:hypothetical protein [Flavobacteriales bacterium]
MSGALLAIAYCALFLFGIRRWAFFRAVPGLPVRWIGAFFVLKVLAGTALWAVYTYIHPDRATADIYKFFDDSAVMTSALFAKPADGLRMLFGLGNDTPYYTEHYYSAMNNWVRQYESNLYNDAHTMIRFNALLRLFSFGHYHVHTVFASLISLIGLVALYKALVPFVRGMERLLVAGVFLWPSLLFWSSGVLKECLLIGGLGLFVHAALSMIHSGAERRALVQGLLGLLMMLLVKYYVLLCLLPPLVAYAWQVRRGGGAWTKFAVVHGLAVLLVLGAARLGSGTDIMYLLSVKQHDFIGLAHFTGSGSHVDTPLLKPDALTFLKAVPSAFHMTFISPFATWHRGALGLMGAVENLLIPLGTLWALWYRRKWSAVNLPMLLFSACFVVLLALIIGWSIPIVGAMLRYRIPLLPFVALIWLLVADPARIPLPKFLRTP